MASTVLRLEAAFRKIPQGVEDDLYASTTRLPSSNGYRVGDSQATARLLRNLLQQIDSGSYPGVEFLQLDSFSSVETASGYFASLTMDVAVLAPGDTITVGGVVLTWQVLAANEDEITIGATSADCATALASAITNHSRILGLLFAEATGDDVLIQTMGCSRWGGLITITTSNALAMIIFADRFLPDTVGAITVAADPQFTVDPADFDLPVWEMLVGQEVNVVDTTLLVPVNTVGPLTVVSVTAGGVVTLAGDAADLAAIVATNVFVPVISAQATAQRMNYGANQ